MLWRFGLLTLALLSTGCAQAALAAILSTGGGGGSGGGSSTASGAPAPGAPAPAAPAGVTQVPVTLSQTTASAAGGDVIRIKLEGVESTAAAAQLPDDTVAPGATGAPLVKVLGEIVTARYVDATTIEFVLPALTIGNHTRQIGIEIEAGRYRGFSRFTYTAFPPACEGFDPPRARPGDEVTVKGKGFVPGCRVFFGNLEAHVTYLGPTRLKARVPALGLGHYECRVVHPEGPESDDDDAESGDDEDDFQRSPPLYSLTLTRATPVARGLSFPVEAHLTADGGVSPVESSLELSVLRADSSVAYVSSKVTSSNRATWNLNLSEVGTYTLRISGYWGYQPSILEQQVTIVPRFRVLELPSTPAQVGQLSPLKVAIWGVGEPDSTATGQVDVRLVGCEQGSLAGTTSRPLEAGEASFVDLGLERPGRYTLRITQGSDQQDHVQTMEIGPAVGLRFLTPAPSQAEAGAPLAPALEVALVDALNNVVESASEVELSLDAN
ncbi:MAG TPA: hypothetical protein DEA08_01685, partial [Planctomycetes bacterium]|nr:hypothetical protein [Planctomycetota bacterium]